VTGVGRTEHSYSSDLGSTPSPDQFVALTTDNPSTRTWKLDTGRRVLLLGGPNQSKSREPSESDTRSIQIYYPVVENPNTNQNGAIVIKFHLISYNWAQHNFFGLYEQCYPTGIVLGSTQRQTGQIHFMTHTRCHNLHATSDTTSDYVHRRKAARTKL
jgi:hypothetical protein